MKPLISLGLLLFFSTSLSAQQKYRPTESWPEINILRVMIPKDKSIPLKVTFTLRCGGKTPLALAREQFQISIYTKNTPYIFDTFALFSPNLPGIFKLEAGEKITLMAQASRNRFDPKQLWSELPSGRYILRINVTGSKTPDFDYQWLGMTYSNEFPLQIK
jgi:hypothetical protein